MNTEFNLTQTLLEKIKEKRPDFDFRILENDYLIFEDGRKLQFDYATNNASHFKDLKKCFVISTDTLLTLIPALFGKIDNPKYLKDNKIYYEEDLGIEYPVEKNFAKVLLQKYLVDGLWLKSREAVLEDLIYNVKKYL